MPSLNRSPHHSAAGTFFVSVARHVTTVLRKQNESGSTLLPRRCGGGTGTQRGQVGALAMPARREGPLHQTTETLIDNTECETVVDLACCIHNRVRSPVIAR